MGVEGTKTPIGAGAGAVVGGVAGSTVGGGRGSVVGATVGAVLGGVGGAAAEEAITRQRGLEITVKLDSGRMIAVTQARMHPPAIAFMDKKRSEGMSDREALRCLKRHIGRAIYKTMLRAEQARSKAVVNVDFGVRAVAVAV